MDAGSYNPTDDTLRNLIKNSEMTTDEAMAAIGISEKDKEMYSAKLSK